MDIRLTVALLAGLSASLGTSMALAATPDIATCAVAFEDAQVLQNQNKLLGALKLAAQCSRAECGNVLGSECNKLFDSFQLAIPSVVLAARDGDGNDLTKVRVTIDGLVAKEQLDDAQVLLDPGLHTFKFEAANKPAVEKSITLRLGEKLRMVSVVIGTPTVVVPVVPVAPVGAAPGVPSDAAKSPPIVSAKALRISSGVGYWSQCRRLRHLCCASHVGDE